MDLSYTKAALGIPMWRESGVGISRDWSRSNFPLERENARVFALAAGKKHRGFLMAECCDSSVTAVFQRAFQRYQDIFVIIRK